MAPKPKPTPFVKKPKPPRPDQSLVVKSLKKDVSKVDEPLLNYVSVEDKMMAVDLIHKSGDEEMSL